MRIGIYEEFPTRANLGMLKNVPLGIELVIAARNLEKFRKKEMYVRRKFPDTVAEVTYWPTLLVREGYWFSPWSKPEAIDRVLGEIENRPDKSPLRVLLDLELPAMVNPELLLTGLPTFEKSKARIERFVRNRRKYGVSLVCTEAPTIQMPEFMQRFLGVAFDPIKTGCEVTKMVYTSWAQVATKYLGDRRSREWMISLLKDEIRGGVQRYGDRFSIGLGLIAHGVMGTEPILSIEQLEQELSLARDMGVQKAYVFRLKGVTKECGKVLGKFSG